MGYFFLFYTNRRSVFICRIHLHVFLFEYQKDLMEIVFIGWELHQDEGYIVIAAKPPFTLQA